VWAALPHNPSSPREFTTHEHNQLAHQQARATCAAALAALVITQPVTWNPVITAGDSHAISPDTSYSANQDQGEPNFPQSHFGHGTTPLDCTLSGNNLGIS
jgi:hypothetical protein